jgi:hypothetical protein
MALEFLKPGDDSYCLYHKEKYLVGQFGRFASFSNEFTIKDWLCMRKNTPLKGVSMFDTNIYNKITNIIRIKI